MRLLKSIMAATIAVGLSSAAFAQDSSPAQDTNSVNTGRSTGMDTGVRNDSIGPGRGTSSSYEGNASAMGSNKKGDIDAGRARNADQ